MKCQALVFPINTKNKKKNKINKKINKMLSAAVVNSTLRVKRLIHNNRDDLFLHFEYSVRQIE